MKILIIEDNALIAESLRQGLRSNYTVGVAATGKAGLDAASTDEYDIVLLDLHLPDMNGQEVCAAMRRNKIATPIIILTGSTDVSDKVALLDSGADDYLTKPFSLEEVRARIRAVLRRNPALLPGNPVLVAGCLELNQYERTLRRDGEPIALRRKEFDILEYLMTQPGKTFTRSMIVSQVWDSGDNLWANVIDVHIKHLRDRIDRPFNSHMIKTVHGVGYKLETSLSEQP